MDKWVDKEPLNGKTETFIKVDSYITDSMAVELLPWKTVCHIQVNGSMDKMLVLNELNL